MTCCGVPVGAIRPNAATASKPGKPASIMVGSSGTAPTRYIGRAWGLTILMCLVDDLLRRAGRRHQAERCDRFEAGKAGLDHGRQLGHRAEPLYRKSVGSYDLDVPC